MLPKLLLPWLMLFLAGACLRTGISSLAPVLDAIQHSLRIETSWLGVLTAIPVVCMGVLSPLGHYLEQRLGMKKTMLAAFVVLIVGLLLRLDSRNFSVLMVTAALVGIADAMIRPLLSGFIKEKFHDHVALAMSIYSASMGLGAAAAAYGTPLLAGLSEKGWRFGLAFWALPALLALLVWAYGPKEHHQVLVQSQTQSIGVSRFHMLIFTLFFGLQAGINYASLAWIPTFYIQAGYTSHTAGLLVATLIVCQMLTSLLFSVITKSLKIRHSFAATVFALITLSGILCLFAPALTPWLAPVVLGVGTGGLFPIALIIPLDFTQDKKQATRLSGITQSGGYLLGGIIPWLTGIAAEGLGVSSGLMLFLLVAAGLLLVISLFIFGAYHQRQSVLKRTDEEK